MKKKVNKAVALTYKKEYTAPMLISKGKGINADKILHIAEKEGIAVKKDADLTDVLFMSDIYSLIPEEQYQIVAEILSFVIKI